MPTVPVPRFYDFEPGDVNSYEFIDRLTQLSRTLEYLTGHMDYKNVRQLFTEYCQIKSKAGETVIDGPTLKMYDKQATPKLRLKMGYNPITGDFTFELYNAAGVKTLGLDSNGNVIMTAQGGGKVVINATDGIVQYNEYNQKRLQIDTSAAGGEIGFYFGATKRASINEYAGSFWITPDTVTSGTYITVGDNSRPTYIQGATKIHWTSVGTITSTSPSGSDGDMVWGTSVQGTGPHIWKAGGWYALQSVAV